MWYWVFRTIAAIILRLFFRLKVEGTENIPQKGNFIVVANHVSFLDPFIVGAAIPKRIYWITLRNLYSASWFVGWFLKKVDTLPSGGSSKRAIYLLEHNKNVGLFPEGTRTHDGRLREFKRGAALLALATGRPILPCAIIGAYEAFPRKARFPKFVPYQG